jgi:hypothetical protein
MPAGHFSAGRSFKIIFFSLFFGYSKKPFIFAAITIDIFMKRYFSFGNYTVRSLKNRFDASNAGWISTAPLAYGDEHIRFFRPISFFNLSPAGENASDGFSNFLPREKTPATVFQAFSRGRKHQRRFFKLSPAGENVSDDFSSFLPREKTSATVF